MKLVLPCLGGRGLERLPVSRFGASICQLLLGQAGRGERGGGGARRVKGGGGGGYRLRCCCERVGSLAMTLSRRSTRSHV